MTSVAVLRNLDALIQEGDYYQIEINRPFWNQGYLICDDGGNWWQIGLEFEHHWPLPTFIHTRDDALAFIKSADGWFRHGEKQGREMFRQELRGLLGCQQPPLIHEE